MNDEEFARMAKDARPRLCLRVGVSGHRTLAETELPRVQKVVAAVFDAVEAALAQVHKPRADGTQMFCETAPLVAVVSPLAEGADRLVAQVAVERKYELRAPLPFSTDEYKKDFPQTVAAFDEFHRYAKETKGGVAELSGVPLNRNERDLAYLGVGEFVVANSDLLIAIWDGKEARGPGGTEQIVKRARASGVPVVHIWSTPPENPKDAVRLARSAEPEWETYASDILIRLICAQIISEVRVSPQDHNRGQHLKAEAPLKRGVDYFTKEPVKLAQEKPDYIYKGPFRPEMPGRLEWLEYIFKRFDRVLGRKITVQEHKEAMPPCGVDEPAARYLFLHHHRADRLSTFYSNVHRGTFLLVYFLGALALSFAVAALEFKDIKYAVSGFTALELLTLVSLWLLVRTDNKQRWRDRWLDYRLLAELLREADLLAQIGRPMPIAKIDEMAQDLPGRAWVMVAYCAIVRRAGIISQNVDGKFLECLRDYAAETRLRDQIAYHEKTEARNESIAKRLRFIGSLAFGATIVVAVVKLGFGGVECIHALHLGLFAGVFPAFAYACFGIRNQAEFEIVSRRSERMIAKLTYHQKRAMALSGASLTAGALAAEVLNAADVMRHDASDWASIFEVKETET